MTLEIKITIGYNKTKIKLNKIFPYTLDVIHILKILVTVDHRASMSGGGS